MSYTKENIIDYINEDDVKFIRLVFLDAFGNQKNVSIMPNELKNVFENQKIKFENEKKEIEEKLKKDFDEIFKKNFRLFKLLNKDD